MESVSFFQRPMLLLFVYRVVARFRDLASPLPAFETVEFLRGEEDVSPTFNPPAWKARVFLYTRHLGISSKICPAWVAPPSTRLSQHSFPSSLVHSSSFTRLNIPSSGWRYHRGSQFSYINLITPCSRILLEKLIGSQLVKKFHTFYGTRRFITAFTSARHLSLSWVSSIQSLPPSPLPED